MLQLGNNKGRKPTSSQSLICVRRDFTKKDASKGVSFDGSFTYKGAQIKISVNPEVRESTKNKGEEIIFTQITLWEDA